VSEVFDCTTPQGLAEGVAAAVAALRSGGVVVLPTDTVYGIGADAFDAEAVRAVLAAKGRGRDLPLPVLVPNHRTLDGLARDVPDYARALIEAHWPGPLTLVFKAQTSLQWDLGDTNGTVAVRMPDDEVALAVLAAVGPMAVTSANTTGLPAASTVVQAQEQLADAVAVYLDGGPSRGGAASTILDCTGISPVTLRAGALGQAAIDAVVVRVRHEAALAAAQAAAAIEAERERTRREAARQQAERDRAADPRRESRRVLDPSQAQAAPVSSRWDSSRTGVEPFVRLRPR
jgi:tRNA threonylcarbamoyl adenosine modification protein (Sua5/YciO/YrdC/YwlC family)